MQNKNAVNLEQAKELIKSVGDTLKENIDEHAAQLNDIVNEVGESYNTEDTRIISPKDLYFITGYRYSIFRKNFLKENSLINDNVKCELITPEYLTRSNDELMIYANDEQIFSTKLSSYNRDKNTQIAKDVVLHFKNKPTERQVKTIMIIGDSIQTHNMAGLTKMWLNRMNVGGIMKGTNKNEGVQSQTGYGIYPITSCEMSEGRGGWRITDFLNKTKKVDGSHFDVMYGYKPLWNDEGVFDFEDYIKKNYMHSYDNLNDKTKATDGVIRSKGATITAQENWKTSDYINVYNGETITMPLGYYGYELYNSSKTALQYNGNQSRETEFKINCTEGTVAYMRVWYPSNKPNIGEDWTVYKNLKPDYVILAMGTNDLGHGHYSGLGDQIFNPSDDDLLENKNSEYYIPKMLETMITSIKAYNPNVKIAIQPPLNCGTNVELNNKFKRCAEIEIDYFKDTENVTVLGTYMGQSMYSSDWLGTDPSKTPVSEDNNTYKTHVNDVHKNLASQQNSALWYASWIVNNL